VENNQHGSSNSIDIAALAKKFTASRSGKNSSKDYSMFTVYLSATCYFAGCPDPTVGISPSPFQAKLKDCFEVTKIYPAVICNDVVAEHEITVIMAKKASENIDLLFRLVDQVIFTQYDNKNR
jgi:hypothetical protein